MPPPRKMKTSLTTDYPALLRQVKETLIDGQRRIEQERIKTYWQTGRLIAIHILRHKDRAEYGAKVVKRLSHDLNIHARVLHRCIQFVKTYPRLPIVTARSQFTWTHYRELITIPDPKERERLEERAAYNQWSTGELSAQIKSKRLSRWPLKDSLRAESVSIETARSDPSASLKGNQQRVTSSKPLSPLRGTLYTYRLVTRPQLGEQKESRLLIDLGFGIFRDVDARVAAKFDPDTIIESHTKDDTYSITATKRTAKDLFTYQAFIERVVDGDTLKVRVDLGFGLWNRQTLRLRGIDCPEMDTKEGAATKAFVQSLLKEAQLVIVRTSRSDKYDRYLADVFLPQKEDMNAQASIYLNNLLLQDGHAVSFDARLG